MLISFAQNFIKQESTSSQPLLQPVIPGVNLPASELGYYSITLVICSIFHEIGHALASVKEDVHVLNVGINAIFILPVAYVNISSEKLNALNPWKALRILCAGIWHNIVSIIFAYLISCSLPYVFASVYYINNGVSVTEVLKNSPLLGTKGLHTGDIITRINDCDIKNDNTWYSCLESMHNNKPSFCVDTDLVHSLDESVPLHHENSVYDCCGSDKPDHLCFEYLDNNNGILELPPHVCLPVRTIIERSPHFCNADIKNCLDNLHCIRPVLNNSTNLFKVKRLHKADVVFIGLSSDFLRTVQISKYVPKKLFQSTLVPDAITKCLNYIIVFSTGLAIINLIPCIFMDGQYITNSLVEIVLGERLGSKRNINLVSLIISLCGTMILVLHCIIAVYKMLIS